MAYHKKCKLMIWVRQNDYIQCLLLSFDHFGSTFLYCSSFQMEADGAHSVFSIVEAALVVLLVLCITNARIPCGTNMPGLKAHYYQTLLCCSFTSLSEESDKCPLLQCPLWLM